jgi:TolB-like protein
MLISDLDGARAVRVIERERLNAVLKELDLQASPTVDPATSQRIGRVLGVEFLLLGSYFELMGQLRVDARLVRVETGEIVRSEGVTGSSQDLFALERQLALKILQGLGARLDVGEEDRLRKGGSADLPHMLAYAQALDLYDRGERRAAVSALEEIVRQVPTFPQAERSLVRMRTSL